MAASPYLGSINFPGYSGSYQGAWQGSRDLSQSLVNAGLGLYNQQAGALFGPGGWGALPGQYANLSNAVLGGLRGANRSNVRDIQAKYTQLSGQQAQDMINRGLGNTTIQQSVQQGLAGNEAREVTASRNSFANLLAGYQSQLGLAGLAAQQQGLAAQQAWGNSGLGFLGNINVGYPDRSAYMSEASAGGSGMPIGYGRPTGGFGPSDGLFAPGAAPVDAGGGGGFGLADYSYASAARLPTVSYTGGYAAEPNLPESYAGGNYGGMYANPTGAGGSYEGYGLA